MISESFEWPSVFSLCVYKHIYIEYQEFGIILSESRKRKVDVCIDFSKYTKTIQKLQK